MALGWMPLGGSTIRSNHSLGSQDVIPNNSIVFYVTRLYLTMTEEKEPPAKEGLSAKFYANLKLLGVSAEELRTKWKYAGGDRGSHYKYFLLKYGAAKPFPDHKDACLCEHSIKENCYITDGERILVIGNCCIKRFISKDAQGRTCDICGGPHHNRKVNRCNDCREGRCDTCGVEIDSRYQQCRKCKFPPEHCQFCGEEIDSWASVCMECSRDHNHQCETCDAMIKGTWRQCFKCKYKDI